MKDLYNINNIMYTQQNMEPDDNFTILSSSETKFIREASGCIPIKSLAEYQETFKDKKPIDIYLQHCKDFSSVNLKKESLYVNEYRFSANDFFDGEKPKSGPQVLSQEIIALQMTVEKSRIKEQFKNDNYFRLFKNIVFVNGQQMLIVKTWQKVRFQELVLNSNDSDSKSDKAVKQSKFFHIKTMNIYDTQNQKITEIVLEQIEGDFDKFRIYDASFLQLNQFIYYYKRLRNMNANPELKLFKYDLLSFREELMPEIYTIKESGNIQMNIIFSEKFGTDKIKSYPDEKSFLSDQYISLQQYVEEWGQNPAQIICLGNVKEPCCSMAQSEKMHQILQVNNIQNYKGEGENSINFILINMIWTVILSFKKNTKTIISKKFKNTDSFQKIWNPDVQVQKIELQIFDEHDRPKKIEQYFFFDAKNKIQILYPNYSQKVERIKFIEHIAEQMNLNAGDESVFKKITLLTVQTSTGSTINFEQDHDHDCEDLDCQIVNSILEIDHLKMILNREKLTSAHILTYCEDSQDQILYITEAKSQFIEWIYMKDHHCEDSLMETLSAAQDEQDQDLPASIINIMKHMLKKAKGRLILSRKQNTVNLLQTYLHDTISNLCVNSNDQVFNFNLQEQNQMANKLDMARKLSCLKGSPGNTEQNLASSFQEQMRKVYSKSPSQEELTLTKDELLNHITVQDLQGKKIKIRTHTLPEEKMEKMSLILYVKTQNHYFFIFVVTNTKDQHEKQSHIFIRKSFQEMQTIFSGCTLFNPLIADFAEVLLLRGPNLMEVLFFESISDHQLGSEYIDIKLTFFKVNDENQAQNFVPFVYQEYQNLIKNQIIVFDIYKNLLSCQTSINPSKEMMQYIYEDDNGYNVFQLCRTSDIIEEDIFKWYSKRGGLPRDMKKQTAKYQVFSLSKEKLGIIHGLEFLISFSNQGVRLQQIGQKLLFISNKSIQDCDWIHVRKSQVVPFYDLNGSIKGCQYIFKASKTEHTYINMLEQELNNIYTYESQVVQIGQKKYMINRQDQKQFIYVCSVILRQDIIDQNIFERSEVYYILKHMQDRFLGCKIPNLRYMVMNDFSMQKELDFFKCQEILLGQTICDICLSDPTSIKKAIRQNPQKIESNVGSIIYKLSKGDRVRKDTLEQVGLFNKTLVIQADLNFVSTIEKGISQNNILSIRILLKQIFQNINSSDYINLIMQDLPCILSQARLTINEFFERSQSEFMDKGKQGFCNMEIPFVSDQLPVFSDQIYEYENVSQFKNFHNINQELQDRIVMRDLQKPANIEKNIEVEHHYIDFQIMQIGEKLRKKEAYLKGKLKFNNLYYTQLLTKNSEENLEFYMKKTTQIIIDSQYQRTKAFLSRLFMLYLICYCLPFLVILFAEDYHNLHNAMARLCLVTQIFFFGIELIQWREQGLSYFMGWNIIDFSQFWVYCMFYYFRFINVHPQNQDFMPQLHFLIVMLSFVKFLFFIRIYQEYGFLVQMVILTIKDLMPFFASFMISMIFFAICFFVLNAEIDPEIEQSQGPLLSFFGLTCLQVYRISIGEIGTPKYDALNARPDSFFKDTNIILIWFTWYINTFFMIVILLNFLIAVISQSYVKVIEQQNIYSYMHKAELNEECYQLLTVFTHLKEYKIIIFSYSKDHFTNVDDDEDNQHVTNLFDHLRTLIKKESKKSTTIQIENAQCQMQMDERVKIIEKQVNKIQSDQIQMKNEILAALRAKK